MLTFHANRQHLKAAQGEAADRGKLGKKAGEKVGEKVGENLSGNQRQILILLGQNPRMPARELAMHVGISSRKIEHNIAKLKEMGLLKRIGAAKGGHWTVSE